MPEITRKLVRLPKPVRLYRNPVYLAEEWRNRMQNKGFSKADLARELGVSRARVTQVMNILKLSKASLEDLRALGDPMSGRRMTERMLRKTC